MPRTLENRSISFSPEVFAAMEDARQKLFMSRSEFVSRCVIKYLIGDRKMDLNDLNVNALNMPAPYSREPSKKG